MPHVPGHQMSDEMQRCIDECLECHRVCEEAVCDCLKRGGRHAEAAHILLLLDCAQICATSADFMARGSDLHAETCAVCADVCERCARDCEQLGDDPVMRACAEACRRCAEACRQMAGGMTFRQAA